MKGYDISEDTTQTVLELDGLKFGDKNELPSAWWDHLKTPVGKPNLAAALVLSEAVYWLSPLRFRDDETGQVVFKKRFKGDTWQMNYQQVADRFGISKRQVQRAVTYLVELGIIKRDLRTVKTDQGKRLGNVVFIDLDIGRLKEISQDPPPITKFGDRVSPNLEIAIAKFGETYTDLSTTDPHNTEKIPEPVAQAPNGVGEKEEEGESPLEEDETPHKKLMRLYHEALGYPIPNGGQEASAAKKILKNYTPEEAIGCYRFLKSGDFWADKHLSLQSVTKQLGPWVKSGKPKAKRHPNNRTAPAKMSIEDAARANQRAMEKLKRMGAN